MDKNCKLTGKEAKMEATRKRAKMRAYIGNGIGKLISKPAVSIPALLSLLAFVIATWQVPTAPGRSNSWALPLLHHLLE